METQPLQQTIKPALKDNPKFLIASSIIVPIFVSVIGLTGVLVPNVLNKQDKQNTDSSNAQVVSNTNSSQTAPTATAPKDAYGYLSIDDLIASIKTNNINLLSIKTDGYYEVQYLNGEYYLVGFTKKDISDTISLFYRNYNDYTKLVGIKFSDITKIEKGDVKLSKKEVITVLNLQAKGYRIDIQSH